MRFSQGLVNKLIIISIQTFGSVAIHFYYSGMDTNVVRLLDQRDVICSHNTLLVLDFTWILASARGRVGTPDNEQFEVLLICTLTGG